MGSIEKPQGVFEINFSIGSSDVDFNRRVNLTTLFQNYQDIAATHAGMLGASVEGLRKHHHAAWILMRMRVEVDRYPLLSEDVLLKTWPQKPRAIHERDYLIMNSETKDILVRAAADWVIMDLDKREIIRTPLADYSEYVIDENRALAGKMKKMKPDREFHFVYEKVIKYSDIDYNRHINNAKYVDYIMDCIPVERHSQSAPNAIEVHYTNEAMPGDSILLSMTDEGDDGKRYVVGTSKNDERQIFVSVLEY